MWAKRELDEYAADGVVLVELLDNVHNVVDLRVLGKGDVLECDSDLFSGLGLHAHVHG